MNFPIFENKLFTRGGRREDTKMVIKKVLKKYRRTKKLRQPKFVAKRLLNLKIRFTNFPILRRYTIYCFFLSQEETGLIKEIVLCFILNFKKKFQFLLLKRRAFGKSRGEEK